jgi:hypothetical protein
MSLSVPEVVLKQVRAKMNDETITIRAYNLATERPDFLANILERYCAARKIDRTTLCAGLGISQNVLWRLGISRRPANQGELEKIAEQFRIEAAPLLDIYNWVEQEEINEKKEKLNE